MPSGFQAFGSAAGFVGSPAFSPDVIPDLSAWYRADLGVTLNAGNVSSWENQSATGDPNRDLVQATAGVQPIYSASDAGYNGKPTLNFATGRYLASGTWAVPMATSGTTFVVCQFLNAATEVMFLSAGAPGEFYANATDDLRYYQGADLAFGAEITIGAKHVYAIDRGSATAHLYQDAVTAMTTGNSGTGALTDLRVGGAGGGAFSANGKMAELIVYSRVLTLAERTAVMQYLGVRYAVTIGP